MHKKTKTIYVGRWGTQRTIPWHISTSGNPHLMIVGLPGMGKTTLLLNIIHQLMQKRIHPIVFSFHEDLDEKMALMADRIKFIEQDHLNFNPLTVTEFHKHAHLDIAANIRDTFQAIFPEIGDLQANKIYAAIKWSFMKRKEPAFGDWYHALRTVANPDRSLRSLMVRLGELGDYGLFSPNEKSDSLFNRMMWDATVIQLHRSHNDNVQRTIAALTFYNLYKEMLRSGVKEQIHNAVIFDEAHKAAKLKLLPQMAKECRKYGISLIVASQEAKDFDQSLFSAIGNYCILRVNDMDARALAPNLPASKPTAEIPKQLKNQNPFAAIWSTPTTGITPIQLLKPSV